MFKPTQAVQCQCIYHRGNNITLDNVWTFEQCNNAQYVTMETIQYQTNSNHETIPIATEWHQEYHHANIIECILTETMLSWAIYLSSDDGWWHTHGSHAQCQFPVSFVWKLYDGDLACWIRLMLFPSILTSVCFLAKHGGVALLVSLYNQKKNNGIDIFVVDFAMPHTFVLATLHKLLLAVWRSLVRPGDVLEIYGVKLFSDGWTLLKHDHNITYWQPSFLKGIYRSWQSSNSLCFC